MPNEQSPDASSSSALRHTRGHGNGHHTTLFLPRTPGRTGLRVTNMGPRGNALQTRGESHGLLQTHTPHPSAPPTHWTPTLRLRPASRGERASLSINAGDMTRGPQGEVPEQDGSAMGFCGGAKGASSLNRLPAAGHPLHPIKQWIAQANIRRHPNAGQGDCLFLAVAQAL